MKIRQFQNGCDYNSQSHPFFVCRKMLPICLRNAPYLSLSVEPIKFRFLSQKNAPYLSPCYYKSLSFMLLYQANSMGFEVKKSSLFVPNAHKNSQSVPEILPKCLLNIPNLSPKCSLSVPEMLPICPQRPTSSLSVSKRRKMLPICPSNVTKVSPKCSETVSKMLLICPQYNPLNYCKSIRKIVNFGLY